DTGDIEIYFGAFQPTFDTCFDIPLTQVDRRSHRFEAFEMLIDRPRPNRTPSRQRYTRFTTSSQQRSHDKERSTHLTYEIVRRFAVRYVCCIDRSSFLVDRNLHTDRLQYFANRYNVVQQRDILNHTFPF